MAGDLSWVVGDVVRLDFRVAVGLVDSRSDLVFPCARPCPCDLLDRQAMIGMDTLHRSLERPQRGEQMRPHEPLQRLRSDVLMRAPAHPISSLAGGEDHARRVLLGRHDDQRPSIELAGAGGRVDVPPQPLDRRLGLLRITVVDLGPAAAPVLTGPGHIRTELPDHKPDPGHGEVMNALTVLRPRRAVVVRSQQGVHELCEPRSYPDAPPLRG
jgi:hypothetical protein